MRRARQHDSGSVILFLIIVIALVAGGIYFLGQLRKEREAQARAFGREIVQRLTVDHDVKYLHSVISIDHREEFPPAKEADFINQFAQLGRPAPDWQLAGDVSFENRFFSPRANFQSILRYPDRHATIYLNVSCAHGPWELDALGVTWERIPEN